jgi:type III secretion system FlhB-like substrate exporter
MSHYRIVFLLSLALAFVTSSAQAQSFAPSAERGAELLAGLELKASQKVMTKSIISSARKEAIRMRADVEIAGIDLRIELEKATPSEKVVSELIERISTLEGQLWKSRVVAWIQVQKLLSSKQRRQLQRLRNAGGGNIVKTPGGFINPFLNYDPEERRDTQNSRLRKPFAKARRRAKKAVDPQEQGEVQIATKRAAIVFVDGKRVGSAPVSVRLTAGRHHIRSVFKDGSTPVVRSIRVKAQTQSSVQID